MTMCEAMSRAIVLAASKGFGVYVMRDTAKATGFVASVWCDHCPSAVVGVVMPDGSFFGI